MCANVALMQSGEGTQSSPQFETAEFPSAQGGNVCFVCHQPVSSTYYRVNSRMACAACTERLRNSLPKDSHAAFVRAVLFGAAAAVAGLALYAMVGIVTGLMIGYVSLAVGWLVGKAMMKGSGGLGGRRYQIVAVLFTYAAVSMAAIPIGIAEYMKEKKPQQGIARGQGTATAGEPDAGQGSAGQGAAGQGAADSQRPADASDQNVRVARKPSIASAMGSLALMGLASPFMELASDSFHGLIGLVILLVGVRIAWQLTRARPPLVVDGPF